MRVLANVFGGRDYVFQQVDGAWKLNDLELDD
jgi:hypothetical protein